MYEESEKKDAPEMDAEAPKKLSSKEQSIVDQAMSMLQPIADKHGCEVSELLESDKEEASEDESDDAGDTGKLDAIVARMKSKSEAME